MIETFEHWMETGFVLLGLSGIIGFEELIGAYVAPAGHPE